MATVTATAAEPPVIETTAIGNNPVTRNPVKTVLGTYRLTVEVVSTREGEWEVFWVDVRDEQGRLVKSNSFPSHADAYLYAFGLGI